MAKTLKEFGHIDTKQLTMMIGHKFYFKNMYRHIRLVCRSCDTCIKNKSRIGCYKAPLSLLGPATRPFEIVSIDSIGGFKDRSSTKRYIHLLTDHFTRYAWIVTSKLQVGKDFINLISRVRKVGTIETSLSDRYPGINSNEFEQYLKRNDIKLVFTAADCAFSNGLNERANQTLVNRIRCKVYECKEKSWPSVAEQCVKE